MSREFTEPHVRGLCLLADIAVLKVWELPNQYWPEAYAEERARSPWFLVKTPVGMLQIGWRKRVLSIDWTDTPVRQVITPDDVTKDQCMVHAYSYAKAMEYLIDLGIAISRLPTKEA